MRKPVAWLIGGALAFTALVLFGVLPALESGAFATHYKLGFADDYDLIANSLATGHGYRLGPDLAQTMIREPGYPLLLAGVFKLFGYGLEGARLANLLLTFIAALLAWRLALRVTGERLAGLVAVAIFLLHPGTLIAEARGGVEIPFMCAVLAFFVLLYRAIDADRRAPYFLAGLALGATVLVRSTPLFFPLLLVPYLVWTAPQGARGRRLAQCALMIAGMALAMSPWIARNYSVSGLFVPSATVLGVAAQEGQYTCERISLGRGHELLQAQAAEERNRLAASLGMKFKGDFYQYFYTAADEIAFNRTLAERSFGRYREEPALLARCVAQNLVHFWVLGKNGLATGLNAALQLPLLALAIAGFVILRRRAAFASWAPIALFVVYVLAVHVPLMAHARHSIPLVPFLAIFAGAALAALKGTVFFRQLGKA